LRAVLIENINVVVVVDTACETGSATPHLTLFRERGWQSEAKRLR
jgi:hypothetical protein